MAASLPSSKQEIRKVFSGEPDEPKNKNLNTQIAGDYK